MLGCLCCIRFHPCCYRTHSVLCRSLFTVKRREKDHRHKLEDVMGKVHALLLLLQCVLIAAHAILLLLQCANSSTLLCPAHLSCGAETTAAEEDESR